METLRKDIRHTWRAFRDNKLFTATAAAALTLGIGVDIAIFSVVNAVRLKPIPYEDPDSLVVLMNTNEGAVTGPASSPAKYVHWRAHIDVLKHVTALRTIAINFDGGDTLESIQEC